MKRKFFSLFIVVLIALLCGLFTTQAQTNGEYGVVIEGYDWGPAVNKVILSMEEQVTTVNWNDYNVMVQRSSDCATIPAGQRLGSRNVIAGYVSNADGERVGEGNHVTLVLAVAPNQPIGSPIQYSQAEGCRGNSWIDYKMTIQYATRGLVWNEEVNRVMPLLDRLICPESFHMVTSPCRTLLTVQKMMTLR